MEGDGWKEKTKFIIINDSTLHFYVWLPWDFFGRNDAKAETPVLWPPHAKS